MYDIAHGDSRRHCHLQWHCSLQMKGMLFKLPTTDVSSVSYQAYQGKRGKLALFCLASTRLHAAKHNTTEMALKVATESAGLLEHDVLHVYITLYP